MYENRAFRALMEGINEVVVGVDQNYQIVLANSRFTEEFGKAEGGKCYQVWKKRDMPCEVCIVQKAFKDGQIHCNEEVVIKGDGKAVHMRVTASPVTDEAGQVLYVLETAVDITARDELRKDLLALSQDTEGFVPDHIQSLREASHRYRSVFEQLRDAIVLVDPDGRVLEINKAGIRLLGLPSSEKGLSQVNIVQMFSNKEDMVRFQRQLFRDEFVKDFETTLSRRDREPVDILITANVTKDITGRFSGYVMILRDITKRKKVFTELQVQNQRLKALNDVSSAISSSIELSELLQITAEKIQQIMSSDCVRIYLLDSNTNELHLMTSRGLSSEFLCHDHVQRRLVGEGLLGKVVDAGEPVVADNTAHPEDPSSEVLVTEGFRSTAYIPLMAKGHPVGALVVSSRNAFQFSEGYVDFLSSTGNQVGMAVFNAELHENLKRAYSNLQRAQEQLIRSEKMASLGKMAATVAHEINNPLAAVLTYIRLLMKLADKHAFSQHRMQDIRRYLHTMESEISRCGDIVKNLLSFSRQSGGDMKDHPITDIINRTLSLVSHGLEMEGIRLESNIMEDIPHIRCNSRQLQQALLNILINAQEAMGPGGILKVTAEQDAAGDKVKITIEDTGSGIPEQNMDKIFEPFFTTKEDCKGVGLGLPVTYGIITRHRGTIEVSSKLGKGTKFVITLPVTGSIPEDSVESAKGPELVYPEFGHLYKKFSSGEKA